MAQMAQAGLSGDKMKRILLIGLSIFAFSGCNPKSDAKVENPPELKQGERVTAHLDVDVAATEKYRADLKAKFPPETSSELIEKELSAQDYQCGEDPIDKTNRACTKAEPKDKCIEMSIVRTLPYTPDGAQIIKACEMVN